MKALLFIFGSAFLLLAETDIFAQTRPAAAAEVVVTGEIVGEGTLPRYSDTQRNVTGLFVKLQVTNHSAHVKRFVTMSCSWQDNWQTNNPELLLYYGGCDKNVDREINLLPKKSIIFYGFLTQLPTRSSATEVPSYLSPLDQRTSSARPATVRFGFRELYGGVQGEKYKGSSNQLWWSKPVSLEFSNNGFVIEE